MNEFDWWFAFGMVTILPILLCLAEHFIARYVGE